MTTILHLYKIIKLQTYFLITHTNKYEKVWEINLLLKRKQKINKLMKIFMSINVRYVGNGFPH